MRDLSVNLLTSADEVMINGPIRGSDESAYRQEDDQRVLWCGQKNLKSKVMMLNFRRTPPLSLPTTTILDNNVATVETLRFLGTTMSQEPEVD